MAGRVGGGGGTRSARPAPRERHAVDNGGNTDKNTRPWEQWKLWVTKKDAKFGVTPPPPPDIRSQNHHYPRFITLCHQQSLQSNLFFTFSKFISFYIFSLESNFLPFAAAFQEPLQMRIWCWEDQDGQVGHLRENSSLKYASIQLI